MRLLKRLALPAVVAAAAAMPGNVEAATLNFTHSFDSTNTYYSLFVEENCVTNCEVTLSIDYTDGSAFVGSYIDSVQWMINGHTPTSEPDLTATNAGTTADWDVKFANLNANQCSGGSASQTCAEWIAGGAAGGFGPITATILTWTFSVDWATALVLGENFTTGNVRAAYNDADGKNFAIFSPGGGNFGGDGGGGGGVVVPEPASLLLFGMAAFAGAYRMRRRQLA